MKLFTELTNANVEIQGLTFRHYVPCVERSEIKIYERQAKIDLSFSAESHIRGRYLTRLEAKQAIFKLMPEAERRADAIRSAIELLKSEHDFELESTAKGYVNDGFDEYTAIVFKINGIDFEFEL